MNQRVREDLRSHSSRPPLASLAAAFKMLSLSFRPCASNHPRTLLSENHLSYFTKPVTSTGRKPLQLPSSFSSMSPSNPKGNSLFYKNGSKRFWNLPASQIFSFIYSPLCLKRSIPELITLCCIIEVY